MATEPNLLLSPSDVEPSFPDWEVKGVLNPGGIRAKNGKIILYARIAEAPIYTKKSYFKCPVIVSEKEYETASETEKYLMQLLTYVFSKRAVNCSSAQMT
jgi:hypothetical protein